jgi:hypothetical protein
MTNRIRAHLLLLSISAVMCAKCSAQNITVGVLAESGGHHLGQPNYASVRILFKKDGNEWKAFPSDCRDQACLKSITSRYPDELTWTIGFDGRSIGKVTSRTPSDFHYYSDVGQQIITSTTRVPSIGAPSREFGGYSEAKVHRPLVANSQPYFADPDRWKPLVLSPDVTTRLRQAFRKRFPNLCRTNKDDESKLEPFPYHDEDVTPVKGYSSATGLAVAQLHLEAIDCEDVEAGFQLDDPWFLIGGNKAAAYLDSGMWLVDAGDYDNDGKSEVIFSINRENEGGYEIWYDEFKNHTVFKFNYH